MSGKQLITFRLAGHHFGIEVEKVQEVLRAQPMTRVPLALPMVVGLINLRGQIVTAIDLRRRLSLPERDANTSPLNVIVRTESESVSLLVDDIGEVITVDGASFEAVPATVPASTRELVTGVYKLPGRLLLVLDSQRAIFGALSPPTAVATAHGPPRTGNAAADLPQ